MQFAKRSHPGSRPGASWSGFAVASTNAPLRFNLARRIGPRRCADRVAWVSRRESPAGRWIAGPVELVSVLTSTSPVWSRLDPVAQGKIVSVDLKAHGITNYGTLQVRGMGGDKDGALELFADGVRQELARWPDASATNMKSAFVYTASPLASTSFGYTGDRPTRWTNASSIWVHGFWGNLFGDQHLPVTAIDTVARTVSVSQSPNYAFKAGQPFYAYNLLEELTVPGEWYLDRATGILYLWPTRIQRPRSSSSRCSGRRSFK